MAERGAIVRMGAFSYSYPDAAAPALRSLELEVEPGEFVVLAGRSGSGKSSLLRACCGLVPHYHGGEASGVLEVCGLDVREHGPAELGGLVGLVGQDPETQVVSATVRGELELPLELRGEPDASRARAIEEVTLALAIDHLLERPTDTLSGGELQRVALAAALVLRPRLILLDEPTSQLDPVAGDELIGLLRRLNEEWGMTVLLAEHRLERCLSAADRVVALEAGAIAYDGDPRGYCEWTLVADPKLAPPAARSTTQICRLVAFSSATDVTIQRFNDCIRSIPISLTATSRLFRPCRSSQSLHSTFQRPRSDSSLLGQCLRLYQMPLEPCPTCGYALSIVDHHCRHCATASRTIPSRPFDAKHLQQMIVPVVVALSVLVYLIFFR